MKTQLLRLEPYDDVFSACDQIGWSQAANILIIWPDSGHLLTRRLDLVLLQRCCMSLNTRLALVTREAQIKQHAQALRIPIFKSLQEAQHVSWQTFPERPLVLARMDSLTRQGDGEPPFQQPIDKVLAKRPGKVVN